jgi:hypothetical protein
MGTNVFENLYQEDLYLLPQKTLVLLDRPWQAITEEQEALLTRILGSVKLSASGVQFFTTGNTTVSDLAPFNPARIISFGPAITGVSGLYQFSEIDGIPVICADTIDRLDDPRKKSLWVALRQMFGIG